MKFVKMHGTGNDFVLVRAQGEERDWPRLAHDLCDRHFGIGADGLILILPSQRADVGMRIFNPDGSEAEMCGNGIRCLAKEVAETGIAVPRDGRLTVETLAGVLTVALEGEEKVERVRVGMGRPRLAPAEIPVATEMPPPLLDLPLEVAGRRLRLTCLSMGNPHAVYFFARAVAQFPLTEVGPQVENHPTFPRRVNFEVARVLSRDRMELRVWERGAGATLACGSGACAAMVAAYLRHFVDEQVDIRLPGGTLTLQWDGVGEVYLTGPAERAFAGEWLR